MKTEQAQVSATPTPAPARALARVVNPIYRFFDWLYGSDYNPLYRSGTLAVGLLFILLFTGLYLSFFYSVSDPHQSIAGIQQQVYFGRWMRALHRYATVAGLIAIFFHVVQLLVQGKNWGPRTLAWLTGVVLTVMFFISAWSGYVMVWDRHGQKIALAGAELIAAVPVLHDIVLAAFDGSAPIPAGFFFMNLFLHVALPVLMIMFLWVHTARLARAVWFPTRAIMTWSAIGLFVLALLWPAPLLERADLLRVPGRIPSDLAAGFWIPLVERIGAYPVWILLGAVLLLVLGAPWWWRPSRKTERPKSIVDEAACTGCTQCARDCPYEAISMIPRSDGKRLVALVDPRLCVSCGICAASCAYFAVGPPGRSALDQRARVEDYCAGLRAANKSPDLVMVACTNNTKLLDQLGSYAATANAEVYPVECCGCLHVEVIEQILTLSKGLALIGCPARNCFNRDGGELLTERIFEKRVPFLARGIDRSRLMITTFSEAETREVHSALAKFSERLGLPANSARPAGTWAKRVKRTIASAVFLALCGFIAQAPSGREPERAVIRAAGLLPSSVTEECRPAGPDDFKNMPLHMRPKEICASKAIEYTLVLFQDGNQVLRKVIRDRSGRTDRPLFMHSNFEIAPGEYLLSAELTSAGGLAAKCSANARLQAGEIFLFKYDRERSALLCNE